MPDLTQDMHVLAFVGLLLILSQVGGRVAGFFGAPRLTGYLLVGVAFGPSLLNLFPENLVSERLGIVTEIALGIIAFSIGGALEMERIRKLQGIILWVTVLESTIAAVCVFATMWVVIPLFEPHTAANAPLAAALIFGAMSAATAPAAIMSIVHEYRASGELTTVLLGVVAIDDSVALLLYSFAATSAAALLGADSAGIAGAVADPLREIGSSLLVGLGVGLLLRVVISYFAPRDLMLGLIFGAVLLTSGVALSFELSPLLATMAMGFTVANFVDHERADEAFDVVGSVEEPILGAFFALAGAHLDLHTALVSGGLALMLTFARFGGKLAGAHLGARISGAPDKVRRYLGPALLPAAGVAIGLALDAGERFGGEMPALANLLVSCIVGATLINELVTPFAVRHALSRAGELNSQRDLFPGREKPHSHRHHRKQREKKRAASGHTFPKRGG